MFASLLAYGIAFLIQAVFLFVALWIMIKVQDLNFNYRGLIVTSVLSTGISMLADHWLGGYFSTGIVCGVLSYCVWKVTRADQVDVAFTVAVGTALVFGMNLFMIGWLMGELRVAEPLDEKPEVEMSEVITAEEPEEEAVPLATNALPKVSDLVVKLSKELTVKGVVENGNNSSVIVNTGRKNHTLAVGEAFSLPSAEGSVTLRCESIKRSEVVFDVNGEKLSLRP